MLCVTLFMHKYIKVTHKITKAKQYLKTRQNIDLNNFIDFPF